VTILDEIRAHKEIEVAERQERRPLDRLIDQCGAASPAATFAKALRESAGRDGVALIAEVKRKSPSAGALRADADASALGISYVKAGAAAVSVLTDERFFSGSDSDLSDLRARVSAPLLRKDFTISEYQIYEARTLGANAVLLIAAMLTDEQIGQFLNAAVSLGLDAIVEVHTEEETRRAVALHVPIVGINNRNLADFTVDLATTERLRPLVPDGTLIVGESGISTRSDVERLQRAGVNAVLVGSALVTANDPAAKVRELLGK
jgi:indole-3-glycerol phosphate synthase